MDQQIFPESRNDLFVKATSLFKSLGFAGLNRMTLFASGMGSGKSNIMASLPKILSAGITFVLSPNDQIGKQLNKVFSNERKWGRMAIIDGNDRHAFRQIRAAAGIPAVVFFSCIKKSNASTMNKTAKRFAEHLKEFQVEQKLVLVDELDLHLTEITGGLNPKVSHHQGIVKGPYQALIEYQHTASFNIFDNIRASGAKCIGFSGTQNNMICSKLPLMGYQNHEITLVNVGPITSLYWFADGTPRTTIIHEYVTTRVNGKRVPNRDVLIAFFVRVHASGGKGLIACSNEIQIEAVKLMYKEYYGKEIDCVCITGNSKPDNLAIANAEFVIGMKLVGTGLDLSTIAEGCQFSHGILLSNLSDKESNPLSKNLEHLLRMEVSSSFLQLIARLREGGTFVVPKAFEAISSLGDALQKIFDINNKGRHEMLIVGPVRGDQHGRYYQGILLAIVQNLRQGLENMDVEERPVVESILTELALFDGRDIKAEYHAYKDGAAFDHEYWIKTIELLWSVYLERFTKDMDNDEFEAKKHEMIAAAKARAPRVVQRGNGLREGHEHDERVAELVRARAMTDKGPVCAHCGRIIKPTEVGQVCHVDRREKDGKFTLDNLVWGHKGCDSIYDNEHAFIHRPGGGFYLSDLYSGHKPDMKQWSGISADNIKNRWLWVMREMEHVNPAAFEAHLEASDYALTPA